MLKVKKISLSIIFIFALSMLAFASVTPVSAASATDTNVPEIFGSQSSAINIINDEYNSNNDIETYLTNTATTSTLSIEGNRTFTNQVVDLSESTFGKPSSDWLGTANDADFPATAGVNYWNLNGSTSPVAEDSSATVTEGISSPSPASSGHYYQTTMTFASDTNTDIDYTFTYNEIDGDITGTDNEITSTSHLYIQAAFKIDQDNDTDANTEVGIFVVFSDGATNYILGAGITNGTAARFMGASDWSTAAATAFVDSDTIADTTGQSPVAATGGRFWVESITPADNTWVEVGVLWNIQDMINNDPETADEITAIKVIGWGITSRIKFSEGAVATYAKVRNVMIMDNVQDFSLYESILSTDSSTDKTNNWLNGTSITLDQKDRYELSDGFVFQIPVQRLTFSSHDLIYMYETRTLSEKSESSLSFTHSYLFDTSIGSEEPLSAPGTLYLNISSLSETAYQIQQLTLAGDTAFASDGDLNSGWTIVDTNSAPTINEISDVYTNWANIGGDLRITPKTAIAASNEYTVKIKSSAPLGDSIFAESGLAGSAQQLGAFFTQEDFLFLPLWTWAGIIALLAIATLGMMAFTESKRERRIKNQVGGGFGLGLLIVGFWFFVLIVVSVLGSMGL